MCTKLISAKYIFFLFRELQHMQKMIAVCKTNSHLVPIKIQIPAIQSSELIYLFIFNFQHYCFIFVFTFCQEQEIIFYIKTDTTGDWRLAAGFKFFVIACPNIFARICEFFSWFLELYVSSKH